MNAVVRISLAGASFTIDKEGCIVLDNYLNEIGNHYKDEEEKCEILNDIEERIAEIFSERTAPDGVVSMQSVEYAIALLGRPSQIFGEAQDASADSQQASQQQASQQQASQQQASQQQASQQGSQQQSSQQGSQQQAGAASNGLKKRLYRDVHNRVIAGVCSGLGAYFKIDAVWVRLIWVFLAAISLVTPSIYLLGRGCGYLVVAYIILWIIMPAARTVQQRYSMFGTQNAFDEIEQKINKGSYAAQRRCNASPCKSRAGRVFGIIVGLALALVALGWLIAVTVVVFGGTVFFNNMSGGEFVSYLYAEYPLWITKIFTYLALYLPPLGIIYAAIMLIFNLKAPKWRPGIVIFIVWILSVVASIVLWFNYFAYAIDTQRSLVEENIPKVYDTLYVEFKRCNTTLMERISEGDTSVWSDDDGSDVKLIHGWLKRPIPFFDSFSYVYAARDKHGYEFEVYPWVKIVQQEDSPNMIVNKVYKTFGDGRSTLSDMDNLYTMQDSLITIKPVTISKEKPYKVGNRGSITIKVPKSTVTIVKTPAGELL